MFHTGTPIWEIALRTLAVYFVVVIGLRLFGKRQLGQMSIGDLVMILLIANAVQNAMVGPDTSLAGGLVAAGVLIIVNLVVVRSITRSPLGERIFAGEPTLLVKDGSYLERNIRHEGLAREEVDMAIREHGFADASGVRVAYLEPDGTISVVPMDAKVFRGRRKVKRIRQFKRGTG
ncbi:MAG: DUF421 domain-containing protein [Actinomycetota bacterium]|nr:DUF421 domain-containing protein [Actinomycetota bacterium]